MVDRSYWNDFYKKGVAPENCSTFAASVVPLISKTEPLLEYGCGNGRDAFFFAKQGISVWACDLADEEMQLLNTKSTNGNPKFFVGDFTNLPAMDKKFGSIYSRFTLHAVPVEGASRSLKWAWNNLLEGGMLFIEVRSVKDKMYGKGTKVEGEKDAYINTHYRRFVRKDELVAELEDLGFVLETVIEADGLAVYKDDDPVVIRVHAKKPKAA
jgi:SAM-dependent methyltransferase